MHLLAGGVCVCRVGGTFKFKFSHPQSLPAREIVNSGRHLCYQMIVCFSQFHKGSVLWERQGAGVSSIVDEESPHAWSASTLYEKMFFSTWQRGSLCAKLPTQSLPSHLQMCCWRKTEAAPNLLNNQTSLFNFLPTQNACLEGVS